MGVHGLWQVLEPSARQVTLESLEGRRLAVDISLWLHQAYHGFNAHGNSARSPHLVLLINRIAKLLFYKIRPVFVFDGDQIPVFKRHILRDRQLRRYMDHLVVNKQQKRALAEAFQSTQNPDGSPPKKPRLENVEDDLFALPEEGKEFAEVPSTSSSKPLDTFLAGYNELVSRDDRIAFLADAKQKVKNKKLNDEDIPEGAFDFYAFQRDRILQRHRLNEEIDLLRNEKVNQAAKLKDKRMKMMVIDAHAGSHLLASADSEVEVISPKKEDTTRKSVPWTEFVKQVRRQYYRDPSPQPTEVQVVDDEQPSTSHVQPTQHRESNSGSDDDWNETFHAVDEHAERIREKRRQDFGHSVSKSDAIDNFVGKMNQRKKRTAQIPLKQGNVSSDESDFEEVSLSNHCSRSPSSECVNPPAEMMEDEVVTIESEEEDENELNFANITDADLGLEREHDHRVYADCQQLLGFLGLPYIVAPGEAEAQCAELEKLGLVEGVITDDSDVWLFGGKKVYKNMFSRRHNIHYFEASQIKKSFGLARYEHVLLTMLSGGDYTRGFENVGMVTAIEIFAEFRPKCNAELTREQAFAVLEKIKEWLDAKNKFTPKPGASARDACFLESADRIRMRRAIENNNDENRIATFPNKEVFDAYCMPIVNSNNTAFKWTPVDFEGLKEFIWSAIGWNMDELHSKTHGAFNVWDKFVSQLTRSYQTRITGYAHKDASVSDEQRMAPTKRVQAALSKLFKTKDAPALLEKMPIVQPPKNPLCSAALPIADDLDDFFDESVDEEYARLLAAQKAAHSQKIPVGLSSSKSLAKNRKPVAKTTTKRTSHRPTTKLAACSSELQMSEESSSDETGE